MKKRIGIFLIIVNLIFAIFQAVVFIDSHNVVSGIWMSMSLMSAWFGLILMAIIESKPIIEFTELKVQQHELPEIHQN